ncbi:hypothetical protein XELAEV_18038756mg [Xenopus laevis]|uniref:Protein kinase domain-containing protein n=1 Tax=Xenopus laevis TaxID=8355 RepID=A0A974H7L1_XENLA|nr:hypothetical protein XELAEV_18038756mg [Xenopus laevis]
MEFASGGTLTSHLRDGPLPLERTRFYGACIVLGVQFLHDHNIVHRDIKPENILIDGTGYPKLADFGLSKAVHHPDDKIMGLAGTRCYMAPEMYMKNVYDRCVDWWAVGVTMFEMLVGKLPFNGITNQELKEEIIKASPVYPPYLHMETRRLLQGLLARNSLFRLGGKVYNIKMIKQQCFFKTIDWEALAKKQVDAPFIPYPSLIHFTGEKEWVLTSMYSNVPISEEIQGQFQELFKPAE